MFHPGRKYETAVFDKKCEIDKYFGIHIKKCAIVTQKNYIYHDQLHFFHVFIPIYLTILECPFLAKKLPKIRSFFWLG